ncbi:GTP cyclohydrolase I [Herbiconiux flava]|uniref:GTP cyclohydrolase 1 n=1 Tax=Herbiconiux flava TaxID=881268 RepID=A0A852SN02_9MICO|nr:GTP cyclohydrolase I [Herbiconiux flava]NYD70180.1 GTP cyclohydrolase I [Herbiconiux flava]GLK16933.1 GTP cyclohydrolase 1 [Herbiconiux flava]
MTVDRGRIEAAVSEILAAIGDDPGREGLVDTPRRVGELLAELYAGTGLDPADALGTTFTAGEAGAPGGAGASGAPSGRADAQPSGPVLIRDIAFRSVCEHHLLPFEGVAHVAYLPGEQVAGLGGVVRVVESAASRPQLQERLTDDIADALQRGLGARGVLVVLDARHGCVTARGPRQTGSTTLTLAARGELADPAARAELTALIAAPRRPVEGGLAATPSEPTGAGTGAGA